MYLVRCIVNSEKLTMDEENQNKTDRREEVCEISYQYYLKEF